MDPVDPVSRLVAIEEIKQLKARYFRLMDTRSWSEMASVFTRDAHLDTDGFTADGRDGIVAFLERVLRDARTVHHGHMPEITITSATTARGIWAMFDYVEFAAAGPHGASTGLFGYGHYEEEYVVEDDAWRIANLRLTRLRVDPLPGGQE
ncbi:MAG TPA: nuclear transport factor 2 family protein [Acidimicrobiia bacterium]|nr:nuclear transport factor 2 family protein [Acidimicrobiia bacterium]